MEKHQASARAWEVARGAIDVGALEVDEEMDDDELDDDGEDEDERDEDESQRSKSESMDVDLCKKEQGAETQIVRRHTSHRRGGDDGGGGGGLRLHSLPDSTAPLGFLASCSLKYGKGRHPTPSVPSNLTPNADAWSQAFGGLKGVPEMDFGIANGAYFSPGKFLGFWSQMAARGNLDSWNFLVPLCLDRSTESQNFTSRLLSNFIMHADDLHLMQDRRLI